ncbi:MAG: hypothetical protein ABI658_26820 [Acidimicrobiales bacterium]
MGRTLHPGSVPMHSAVERTELRLLVGGPAAFWALVSILAGVLLAGDLIGSLLSFNASSVDAAQVLAFVAFAASFPLFGIVCFAANAQRSSGLGWSWPASDVDGAHHWWQSLPKAVTGLVLFCVLVIAVVAVASFDRLGEGSTEKINGSYYLINHGDRTQINQSEYAAAATADTRLVGLVGSVFLGVTAIASGTRRNIIKSDYNRQSPTPA